MNRNFIIFSVVLNLIKLVLLSVLYINEYLSLWLLMLIEIICGGISLVVSYMKSVKPISYLYNILKNTDLSNLDYDSFENVQEFGTTEISYIIKKVKRLVDVIEDKDNTLDDVRYISEHDELTGCYNMLKLNKSICEYEKCKCLCVIFVDVNNLKKMNDTLGHTAGDKLLRRASKALRFWESYHADVYRVGGDEFMIVVPDTSYKVCKKLVEKWYSSIGDLSSEEVEFKCLLSYGVAFSEGNINFNKLREEADLAMYRMKIELKNKDGEKPR